VLYKKKATFSSCFANWPFRPSLEHYFMLIISFLLHKAVKGIHPTSDHTGRRVKGGHCLLSFGQWIHVFESESWHGCSVPLVFCICLMCRSVALGRSSVLALVPTIYKRIKELRKWGDNGLVVLCTLLQVKKEFCRYIFPCEIIFLHKVVVLRKCHGALSSIQTKYAPAIRRSAHPSGRTV
jgi:hypothetical protein